MKVDRNGYRESLFNTSKDTCYLCKEEITTARHEVLHGPNRKNSKSYGLWLNLCPTCHSLVHAEDNGKYLYLKEEAQRLFQAEYPDKKFLEIFGRNYL